jgi:AcrR family transcriptional regulator
MKDHRMPASRRTAKPRRSGRRAASRSRAQQGEDTRRAILDAAVELYAEGGFRGTGLIAIGRRAGIHHATVLYHYRTGRELLLAVLEERDRRYHEISREVIAEGGLTALRNLPTVGRFNAEHRLWAKLFTVLQAENLDEDAEVHAYFAKRRTDTRALLGRFLREAKERREIRQDVDVDRTADVILAFMSGAQIQHFLDPAHVDLVAAYERFTAMLLRDLEPRGRQ